MTREEIQSQARMEIEKMHLSVTAVNAIFDALFELWEDDPLGDYQRDEIAAMRTRSEK